MVKNEAAFIKQGIHLTRDWDDFQALLRNYKKIVASERKTIVSKAS